MKKFLKWLWSFFVNTPHDKLLHQYAAAMVALYGFVLAFIGLSFWWAFLVGNLLALAALIGKEVYDKLHPEGHEADCKDVVYGLLGVAEVDVALFILLVGLSIGG